MVDLLIKNALIVDGSGSPPFPGDLAVKGRKIAGIGLALDEKRLPLELAIRKMTAQPAEKMRIPNKGLLRAGYDADIVLLDLNRLKDHPTYADPQSPPEGIDAVFVSGVQVLDKGTILPPHAGRFIERKR